ncbi:MAG: preprotein translocase subunit YajC [Micropruina sp.]|uniref:preprotein translocase subunit YajC n=1 Tax=Micropruina sp. TaxID=2737536 RepID=UPI0039E42D8E
MGSTLLMLVLMGAAFYFLLIRPQQKRAKKQQEMTNSLAPGTRVMLSSGVFGTIRHLGERQAIIEIAPGIEMTVVKQAVVKTLLPEDDEFEYSDDDQVSDDEPEGSFDDVEGSPFDNIQPSDFIDPKPSDARATDDDPTDQSSTQK